MIFSWNIFKTNFYVFSTVNFPLNMSFCQWISLNFPPPTGWITGWNAHIVRILQNPIFRNSIFLSIEVKDNPLICLYGKFGIKQQNIMAFRPCQTQKVALKYVFCYGWNKVFLSISPMWLMILVYTIITNIRYYCIFQNITTAISKRICIILITDNGKWWSDTIGQTA